MSQILNKIRGVDPNNSDAVKEALSTFIQNLNKHTGNDCSPWLTTLEDSINRFPKYCMTHRNTIENYLAVFLGSKNIYDVIDAAKCAHALQQVRPTQEKTATAKTCWRDQMGALCEASHSLIGTIFANSVDIYKDRDQQTKPDISNDTPLSAALSDINEISHAERINTNDVQEKNNLLCTRLRNVLIFIQAMLVEPYPVAKPIRAQLILDVSVRALTVSSAALSSLTSAPHIADIKTQSLRTLDALVLCLGSNLVPFSPLIFRMVMQSLRWTSENVTDDTRKVRCQAYSSAQLWLTTLKCHKPESIRRDAKGKCLEDELVSHIIQDVTPPKHTVQLTMTAQPTKNMSKKAKRKLANYMLQESAIASHMPGEKNKINTPTEVNEDVVISALECAETFLIVCGIFLKPTTHKILQDRLIRECYRIDEYSTERGINLLRAVDACRKSVGSNIVPPTQYCLQIYSRYLNHGDRQISKFCSEALLDIRLHLHCSPPSINFALEPPKESPVEQQNKKTVSERNRAALEALLGSDKIPSQNNDTIITIPDEPVSKKARVEEIQDNISISSADNEDSEIEEITIENDEEMDNPEQTIDNQEKTRDNEEIETEIHEIDDDDDVNIVEDVHDAKTQVPNNLSNDTVDGTNSPVTEVAYDFPNTGTSKVTVLEKVDDENLPSTNETDDQITCGQLLVNSQDDKRTQDKNEVQVEAGHAKVNGDAVQHDVMNGDASNGTANDENVDVVEHAKMNGDAVEHAKMNGDVQLESVTVKISTNETSVEDMLADFVDEVNDDVVQV